MAFENVFLRIADTFENAMDDQTGWHAQLLQRMRLDLMPIRPPVIDDSAYEKLDELRRFRHLFRTAYQVQFNPQRLQLVADKALALRDIYLPQLQEFLEFLKTLQ